MSGTLQRFLSRWNARGAIRAAYATQVGDEQAHFLWLPAPNLYVEHDIGTKMVRYPDGRRRSVRTRKVRDTAGVTFLVFAADTPLS